MVLRDITKRFLETAPFSLKNHSAGTAVEEMISHASVLMRLPENKMKDFDSPPLDPSIKKSVGYFQSKGISRKTLAEVCLKAHERKGVLLVFSKKAVLKCCNVRRGDVLGDEEHYSDLVIGGG
ncbi:MAG: hypothetical protein HY537_10160 [Deltaproteobacteria bacterium]|nr:hypothetical protein [Deltaproteobacteria bacterium]